MDGWVDGWMGVKAVLRIAYSNQQNNHLVHCPLIENSDGNVLETEYSC
jgi:hypothetical protein